MKRIASPGEARRRGRARGSALRFGGMHSAWRVFSCAVLNKNAPPDEPGGALGCG